MSYYISDSELHVLCVVASQVQETKDWNASRMCTKLDRLLGSIDPAKTYDLFSARASNALNTFEMNSAQITDWGVFVKYMTKFYIHAFEEIGLGKVKRTGRETDVWLSMWLNTLCKIYGPDGERVAFDMACTGEEGGLYAVLKALAMKIAEDMCGSVVSHRISKFWFALSYDEKTSVIKEYREKCGHLLPSLMTERRGFRLWANFEKVLNQHPLLLQRLRGICK